MGVKVSGRIIVTRKVYDSVKRPPVLSPLHRCIATFTHSHHATTMSVLPTNVDRSSETFKENKRSMVSLLDHVKGLHSKILLGGSEKARSKHVTRGKMLPREYAIPLFRDPSTERLNLGNSRVTALLDSGTSFLELSPLAGFNVYDEGVPAGGLISGIGIIHGVSCMIIANDSTWVRIWMSRSCSLLMKV